MKKSALFTITMALFALFPSVAYANHSWGNYHWARTTSSFTLKLGDNVSNVWDPYLATSSDKWTLSNVIDTQIVSGANKRNCGAMAGRVEICASKYGNTGWLGIASIWTSGDHITQGTVKMNDTYFNTATYNKASWRQMVMCQEIGHTFGLGHQDENFNNANLGTCMDYTNDPSRNDGAGDNLYPNAHDYSMLETIYAHLDSTTTVSQSSTSLKGIAALEDQLGDNPINWGKEIKRSANGRVSLFEKDLGNGVRIFRHVFWAEPRSGGLH